MEMPAASDATRLIAHWRDRLLVGRERLRAQYLAQGAPQRLLRQHRLLVDEVLCGLWAEIGMPGELALVAVGGYGRGELFPHSDVDVLVLLPAEPEAPTRRLLEQFLGLLWDVGLEVGHSVRTVPECIEELHNDTTIRTTLLENRHLAGSAKLMRRFRQAFSEAMDARAFLEAKLLEQQQRHVRFHDTAYNLEPNLKESPGGLRDLQTVLWVARAAGIAKSWSQLIRAGLLKRDEAQLLARHEHFICHLRIRLHYLAGRREDRLVFDLQPRLAADLGVKDTAHRRASELLMQRYYRSAKAVRQFNVILLHSMQARIAPGVAPALPLDQDFEIRNELLELSDPELFEKRPSAMLDAFLRMQQHSELKGMSAATLRALWRNRNRIDHAFRRDPANQQRFLAFLRQPRGILHELRRMNQFGILGRYIPAFGRIVGQMQHDLFHVYTVDEHILMVVRNLRRFTEAQHAHEYPLCSRLMADFERREVLYLAGLFHDIAKGRGGSHAKLGAVDALRFARQHQLPQDDAQLVAWLVESHLLMSSTAQKQDIFDPTVVAAFAAKVKSERRLAALYMLTVADIRGTGPKVWNAWKAKLLEELFHATRRALEGDAASASLHDSLAARQEEAANILRLYAVAPGKEKALWDQLDTVYFQGHTANEIAWHTRHLFYRVASREPVVKARLGSAGEGLQVFVYLPDQKELFARICGFFGKICFTIVDAKIHTTRHGYALDTFVVLDPEHGGGSYRDIVNYIEYELAQRLTAQAPPEQPTPGRISRHLRHFPITPEITLFPDDIGQRHILEIVAGDRTGLLARIARVLAAHDVEVHSARIHTLGDRVEDVFLVSGASLRDSAATQKLEEDLMRELKT
ncbi:MAG: [protein-PII] uridylyltransferase [Betaproteobacteria bacterium]|nr:[protein-PII] uridylyltransferase [Betaproteobacteria bacterium]